MKYTIGHLRSIAEYYPDIYDGIEFEWRHKEGVCRGTTIISINWYLETNPFEIAEYKADYDMALNYAREELGSTRSPHIFRIMKAHLNG